MTVFQTVCPPCLMLAGVQKYSLHLSFLTSHNITFTFQQAFQQMSALWVLKPFRLPNLEQDVCEFAVLPFLINASNQSLTLWVLKVNCTEDV